MTSVEQFLGCRQHFDIGIELTRCDSGLILAERFASPKPVALQTHGSRLGLQTLSQVLLFGTCPTSPCTLQLLARGVQVLCSWNISPIEVGKRRTLVPHRETRVRCERQWLGLAAHEEPSCDLWLIRPRRSDDLYEGGFADCC